jgi:hypothetical protein
LLKHLGHLSWGLVRKAHVNALYPESGVIATWKLTRAIAPPPMENTEDVEAVAADEEPTNDAASELS